MRIDLLHAQTLLQQQQIVAIPTETVYGLAALLQCPASIEKIFKIKNRPSNNPLIIHAANQNDLLPLLSSLPKDFDTLANKFWPGPLTLIAPCHEEKIPLKVRAGLSTIACRIPDHALTLQLLQQVGPLVAPSANLSGKPSATSPEHIEHDFGLEFPVLDGGSTKQGLESTILYSTEGTWQIVRLGAISAEELSNALGYTPQVAKQNSNKPICPGQLHRHYAPKAKLHLSKEKYDRTIVAVLGFSDRTYPGSKYVIALGSQHKPKEVAAKLYSCLREIDQKELQEVWVDMDFPRNDLWETITDRLNRASQ